MTPTPSSWFLEPGRAKRSRGAIDGVAIVWTIGVGQGVPLRSRRGDGGAGTISIGEARGDEMAGAITGAMSEAMADTFTGSVREAVRGAMANRWTCR